MTTFEHKIECLLDYPRINELLNSRSFFNGVKHMTGEFNSPYLKEYGIYFNVLVGLMEYPNSYHIGEEYENWEYLTQMYGWVLITETNEAMGVRQNYMHHFQY